tara:strand:- start:24 stop:803 length:780 start_codon:yes stop_codon:yes gene_type:complete
MIPTSKPLGDLRFALEALFEGIHTVTTLGGAGGGSTNEGATGGGSPTTQPKASGKKKVKKEEPAEVDVKTEDGVKEEFGVDTKLNLTEPDGLSVNAGALTIVKRNATGKTGVEHALIEWSSDPLTDMIADAVLSVILQLEEEPAGLVEAEKAHKSAIEAKDKNAAQNARLRIVAAMLGVQFGEPNVDEGDQKLEFKVDNHAVAVRYGNRDVFCADAGTKTRVETALERIDMAIADSAFARTLPSVSGVSGKGGSALGGT